MKIAISGASGFVGTHLSAYLQQCGHDIVPLSREDLAAGAPVRLGELVATCDAVINLAGAPIDHRWTARYKEELFASRIDTTRRLVEAVDASSTVKTFISTSAVGYYPSVGCYDEQDDQPGTGLLSHLCTLWEAEARKVRTRCVITRFGVVLSDAGGAFPRMARPAKMGVAVVAGSGAQSFSWIALEDLLRAQEFLLSHPSLDGTFNLVAPEKQTMREFIAAVAARYKSHLTVRIPSWLFRVAMGEASGVLLDGQCVIPHRLEQAGFHFARPSVDDFLRQI